MTDSYPLTSGQLTSLVTFRGIPPESVFKGLRWQFTAAPEQVELAVRHVVARHEALRTTVAVDAGGRFRQRTDPPGTAPRVRRIERPLDADAIDELIAELRAEPFDLARDHPARWAVGTAPDGRAALVCVLHHVAAGRRGRQVVVDEIRDAVHDLATGAAVREFAPAVGPSALRTAEDSGPGRRAEQRHRRYVRGLLAELPNTPFTADVSGDGEPRGLQLDLDAPGLLADLDRHSREWGLPASAIVLAALTSASGHLLPDDSATLWRVLADRSGAEPRGAVVCYQPTTLLVPGRDLPSDLRGAAERLWHRTLVAMRCSGHGDGGLVEEAHRVSLERGVAVEPALNFNFVDRGSSPEPDSSAPERITTSDAEHYKSRFLACTAWRLATTLRITVWAHVGFPASEEPRMRALGEHLVTALRTGTAPPVRRPVVAPELVELPGNRRVVPDAVRAGLESLPEVRSAQVRATARDGLVASVVTAAGTTEAELRAAAVRRLHLPGFAVPDRFEAEPDEGGPEPGEGGPAPTVDPAAFAILRTVLRPHLPDGVDERSSFFDAGGLFDAVPAVLHRLAESGWDGLSWQDLCSHRSLAELAALLHRG